MLRSQFTRFGRSGLRGYVLLLALFVLPTATLAALGDVPPAHAETPTCGALAATIIGTSGNDDLVGTDGPDVIAGLGGSDVIHGMGGDDLICGGGKADDLSGGPGNDRLWGGGGNDVIDGGAGADRAVGGSGTDACAGTETTKSCEAVPPAGCTADPVVEAIADTSNVTLIGSNAFATSSSLLIDGEGRRLSFVAELRNDTSGTIRLGRATITIYNASGHEIGTRYPYAMADSLKPGQTTVLSETMPSLLYFTGETNGFPGGWASWKLTLHATMGQPSPYDDVIVPSKLRSLKPGSGGGLEGSGKAKNSLGHDTDSIGWWVALHDSAGGLLNVAGDYSYDALAPGSWASFEVTIWSDEPTCFQSVTWGAAGS
ncbi:MAG: hypothetical protein A2Z12_05515 [Actinobacteria bacterium RBG_16_68_21]|nr:MAG: hypothetical protein A2Z12_05515 [Actinobacteria bacterium RBG_16_68_21]